MGLNDREAAALALAARAAQAVPERQNDLVVAVEVQLLDLDARTEEPLAVLLKVHEVGRVGVVELVPFRHDAIVLGVTSPINVNMASGPSLTLRSVIPII